MWWLENKQLSWIMNRKTHAENGKTTERGWIPDLMEPWTAYLLTFNAGEINFSLLLTVLVPVLKYNKVAKLILIGHLWHVIVVQSLSHVSLWPHELYGTPGFLISQSLLKLMSIEWVMPSNFLIFCRPLLWPSTFPSLRVFSNEMALRIRWPKYWSFSFSISPSNAYSGLISSRMDWLDLIAIQGTLTSLLQHHTSAFFMVQYLTSVHNS